MAKKKLSREEKNRLKEEKKKAKLEQIRAKTEQKSSEIEENKVPIISEQPIENKKPKTQSTNSFDNSPKAIINPNDYKSMNVVFHLDKKDIIGQWSWGLKRNRLELEYEETIKPYLVHPENTKWGTLEMEKYGRFNKTKHHHMPLGGLNEEIQTRWKEIGLEHPEVFTFRITGKKRIWGFRRVNNYFIVWWDPEHQLIPM